MGYLTYSLLFIITLTLVLDRNFIPKKYFFTFWFGFMFCLSLSIRWKVILHDDVSNDGDLSAFILNMRYSGDFIVYHLKEPVFWYGNKLLYQIFGNAGVVFIIIDLIIFLFFYKMGNFLYLIFPEVVKFKNIKYLYFGAFLCYPYVAGMHNHLRQLLAFSIAIYSFSICLDRPKISYFSFLVSLLVHNAVIILLPVFFIIKNYNIKYLISAIIFLILAYDYLLPNYLTYFGFDLQYELARRYEVLQGKSSPSGRNTFYLLLLIAGCLFVISAEIFAKHRPPNFKVISLIVYFSIIYLFSYLYLSDQASARIFQLSLSMLFLIYGGYVATYFKSNIVNRSPYFILTLVSLLGLPGDGLVYYFN